MRFAKILLRSTLNSQFFDLSCKQKALLCLKAQVVKLVDTPDLGSGAARCVGSSPILGIQRTFCQKWQSVRSCYLLT